MTNDELNELVDGLFLDFIEGREVCFDLDVHPSNEVTVIMAKLAAKFATYAGDALDF